jgi:hypothetical protein
MKNEVWKRIEGYNCYEISNHGRIRSTKGIKPRLLRLNRNKGGYVMVTLSKNNKPRHFYLHRLLAQAWIPNPDDLPLVRHLDDVKTNNNLSNLAWGTYKDNRRDYERNMMKKMKSNLIQMEDAKKKLAPIDYMTNDQLGHLLRRISDRLVAEGWLEDEELPDSDHELYPKFNYLRSRNSDCWDFQDFKEFRDEVEGLEEYDSSEHVSTFIRIDDSEPFGPGNLMRKPRRVSTFW